MSSYNVPVITSGTKASPTTNTKPNRLPAPTLFVGPPSRNASQLSVSRIAVDGNLKSSRPALNREKTARSRVYNPEADSATDDANGAAKGGRDVPTLRKPSDRSIDAKWREMQSTLNEVELTAQSSTQVFGESHAKALDDLRSAQIALAKAWGRGNENQATAASNDAAELSVTRFKGADDGAAEGQRPSRKRTDTEASSSTVLSDESGFSESSVRSGRSQLEDETAQDIKLASERRAANEAYFKKVDQGVKEVVEKLEKVAEAMRSVEGESRSLWSNSDRSSTETEAEGSKRAAAMPAG